MSKGYAEKVSIWRKGLVEGGWFKGVGRRGLVEGSWRKEDGGMGAR